MAISHKDAMLSTFACAMCYRVGLLQMPSPSDMDQVLVASRPPGAGSTTVIDMHDDSSPPSSTASSSDGDWNDVTNSPTFGMAQLKAGFVGMYLLVTALVVQVAVIASDVISLKDRITAVEGKQTPALVYGQETEALTRQVSKLCEQVVSQEDRMAGLELSQRAETDSHKKTIQELTTKLDNMKVDDDKKSCSDALENFRRSFKNFQQSMECQAARITGVKADTARKIALLQSELAGVHAELVGVKTVTVPVNASSAGQTEKEARKARILAGVAQLIEDVDMAEEILCPLPPVVARSSACVTAIQDTPAASTSSGGSSITLPSYRKTEGTTVKNLEITKEPLTTAHVNFAQPGADKIPAIPMIPIPTIPMERLIPTKSNDKENKPCNRSTMTLQDTKTSQPGAGRSPDVSDKPPTASPKNAQPGAGLLSKISALPKPRKSMLPAPRKSHLPSLAKHAGVVDGSSSNEVKIADRLPGGSETQTEQPKTVKDAPTYRPPSESALSRLVEKEPPVVLPTSFSLTALDAALQAMQVDGDDFLTLVPAPNCSNDDLSFSAISPISMKTKRNDNYESMIYVPPKRRSVDVKPSRSPLKSTLTTLVENEVSLPASSSLTALDAALKLQMLQGERDILTLMPGLDYPSVDFSFSAMTPIFPRARPPCKRESIYLSPMKTSTVKPSRRL
ncbi:hypothetical protein J3R82DRAFT_5319 [Butyriboletus roseoflavus]|nr:hypothetical protein J3R82DRAFT_5319 [Butyriboletus roseoflavus]